MMIKTYCLICALLSLLAASACGGAEGSTADVLGSACEPSVGIYTTDLAGNSPSADINTIIANMVSELQQSGENTGVTIVNKVSGFEDAESVDYLAIINTEAYTYRLVDGETGEIIDAASADATVDWSANVDQVAAWLRSTVKTAIDNHDLVTLGAGPSVTVAGGDTVSLDYSVSTTQGSIIAQSTIGTLGGTLLDNGSSTFRVNLAKVEDFTLAIPLDAISGSYAVSVQSVCRYDSSVVIATLEPVTVEVEQSALVGLWCARSQDDPVFDNNPPTTYLGDCSDWADYIRIYESSDGLKATPLMNLCEDEVPSLDLLTVSGNIVAFTTRESGGLNFQGCEGDSFSYELTWNDNELSGDYIGHFDNPDQSDQEIDVIYVKASEDPCLLTSWNNGTEILCQ
jgi:hypothetical protein